MGRLIIDITELAQWEGKLTGVPRVMNELSMRFARQGNTEFVMWDSQLGQFYKVAHEELARGKADNAPTPASQTTAMGAKAHLVKNLKSLSRRSRLAQKGLVMVQKGIRVLKPHKVPQPAPAINFVKGDTLFVLADWHGNDSFMQELLDLKSNGVRLAQISYDLLPIIVPHYSGHATTRLTQYIQKVYPLCNVVFSISHNTKDDIVTYLKNQRLPIPRIEVMRLGDDFKKAGAIKPKDGHFNSICKRGKKFLLCVGTIEARKNHTLLYYTYKLAAQKGIELPSLVIVGRRGWLANDIYEMMTTDPVTKEAFIFLQNISDEELSWLYNNCLFSIYPSFYEGWGLPIAESITYGAPCIASNTSSMPEIAGDLISYFSPLSTDECLAAIRELLDPEKLKNARRSVDNYKPTSWNDTFKGVSQVLGRDL